MTAYASDCFSEIPRLFHFMTIRLLKIDGSCQGIRKKRDKTKTNADNYFRFVRQKNALEFDFFVGRHLQFKCAPIWIPIESETKNKREIHPIYDKLFDTWWPGTLLTSDNDESCRTDIYIFWLLGLARLQFFIPLSCDKFFVVVAVREILHSPISVWLEL